MKITVLAAAACAALLFASPMLVTEASAAAPPVLSMPADIGCTLAPVGDTFEICDAGVNWVMVEAVPDLAAVPVAFDPVLGAQLAHFAMCWNLMLHDSAAHAAQCGPGHDVFVHGSSGTSCGDDCPPPTSEEAKQAG